VLHDHYLTLNYLVHSSSSSSGGGGGGSTGDKRPVTDKTLPFPLLSLWSFSQASAKSSLYSEGAPDYKSDLHRVSSIDDTTISSCPGFGDSSRNLLAGESSSRSILAGDRDDHDLPVRQLLPTTMEGCSCSTNSTKKSGGSYAASTTAGGGTTAAATPCNPRCSLM